MAAASSVGGRDVDEGQGERPGADPRQIQRDEPEPGGRDRLDQPRSQRLGHGTRQVAVRQLDAGDVPVVADPAVGEPEVPHRGLGLLDLPQLARLDRLEVGDPRGEARGGGLVRARQPPRDGQGPNPGLADPGVGQGTQHPVLAGGQGTGPVRAAGVVGVLAVGDGVEPVGCEVEPVSGEVDAEAREQLVLAVVTPVRTVGPVGGTVPLPRRHLDHPGTDGGRDLVGPPPFGRRQARRHPENGDHPVTSQGTDRQREQDRRVDPTREGDAQAAGGTEPGGEGGAGPSGQNHRSRGAGRQTVRGAGHAVPPTATPSRSRKSISPARGTTRVPGSAASAATSTPAGSR